MTRYALGYVLTGLSFALIDSIWLRTMYTRLYQPEIGELLGGLRLGPAIAFYLLYIGGMMWFAVGPALANGRWQTALVQGAVLGFMCYATYDLTNFATLKIWSMKVTLLDIMWGTVLTGSASLAGWAATQAILGRSA
ncbi:MAG: DUF2177 family protein [Sphingomonadaceae bacterium]|nr:DUF2177 family protein [Sphingomonadaceae bacterium]